ncbi:sugar transferase [Halorussus lipolyticus]|uniref:sugar transferase n=1 Tax=Halorussus lipolyticus TaxID=3034024 RepID=UPI0023E8318A|nr:sugar transferase [Halorussus sp. DT80]
MVSGHWYRAVSIVGTLLGAVTAVVVANHPGAQWLTTVVPVFRRLPAVVLTGDQLLLATATSSLVIVGSLLPLFKPRPRRILDTILLTQKRVVVAGFAMATVGYFDYTYPLPRSTLALTVAGLLVVFPIWFVAIGYRPGRRERAVIIGDDPDEIRDVLDATDVPVLGYVSPPSPYYSEQDRQVAPPAVADGSGNSITNDLDCLGGLSRLDEVLVEYDIDTAVLAFAQPDRAEFFGALDACYEHGVDAKVHRDHTDNVLTAASATSEEIVDIELEPWDWQDYVFKRIFDVVFAATGLFAFAPFLAVIAIAIKLDSPGPVFYSQERTAEFGETFEVYKFRSMVTDAEAETGATISDEDAGGVDPRITRVGKFLRQTHLDEVPQLWSILVGDMSVVGPRPERPELDADIRTGVVEWRKRWFIKPGLTGLAQIHGATGKQPEEKLRYDVEYVRSQSFWFDVKIVLRQVWDVLKDGSEVVFGDRGA